MYPVLDKLGIRKEVQEFFQHSFSTECGNELIFPYGNVNEYYNDVLHLIPVSDSLWLAGDQSYLNIREVMICSSAMEAISFLSIYFERYRTIDHLLFISPGILPCQSHYEFIRSKLKNKKVGLVMGRDLLGRVSDIKVATGIHKCDVVATLNGENMITINFRNKAYEFSQDELTLNAFEKKSGFRSHIKTYKIKTAFSFLNYLKSDL